MPWRHPGSCVNDLVPKIGFNPEDVKKLGEFVVKLRNIPVGVLVILGLSRAWWNHRCDPVIREGNNVNGSKVQAEALGLSWVIQERIPNNTTLPDAPRIVIPTPRATRAKSSNRKRHARRSYRADSGFGNGYRTTPLHSMLLELLYRTVPQNNSRLLFRAKRFWPELKPPEIEKPLLPWGFHLKALIEIDLLEEAPEQIVKKNEDQVLNVLPLRSVGVTKGGNIGGQAMPPPQVIHTGFDPWGSGADDLGNQVADDAPMNGNDYEIDGGNDHSHDGGHPIDVENHEEPKQASSVPNDTSDRIERKIASLAPSPYYLPCPFEEGERFNVAMYLGRSRRSIMIQTIATSLANDKEKSKGRKKLVRCQEKTIGKLTTEGTRLKKELHDACRASKKKSDYLVKAQSELEIMTSDVKDLKKSLAERESELLGLKDEYLRRFRVMSSDITKMKSGIEESHHGPSDALHNPS
ncbi:hypothetical protein Tco_0574154 [Tanacetum coccineum]